MFIYKILELIYKSKLDLLKSKLDIFMERIALWFVNSIQILPIFSIVFIFSEITSD